MKKLTLIAALVAALSVGVPGAGAAYDPLGSGRATLTLDPAFRKLLAHHHLELAGREGVKVRGQRTVTLPVVGGKADPAVKKGTFELGGDLLLRSSGKQVAIGPIDLKAKPSPFVAKVGGGQQKVARAKNVAFQRRGFGYRLLATGLRLSANTATRLNKRLDTAAFEVNQPLGSLAVLGQPAKVVIEPVGRVTLVPTPEMQSKLSAHFISLNPISPAELSPGPVFTLPISVGGTLAPSGRSGVLRAAGALEALQQNGGQIFWQELWSDLGSGVVSAEENVQPSPPFAGKEGRIGSFGLDLATAQVESDAKARTISVAGATLFLQAGTAAAMNQALAGGEAVFAAGEPFATVSFLAQGH